MLIVFSGLPGSGKSTVARALAAKLGAVWLRVDSIEQAIRDAGAVDDGDVKDAGYRAAQAAAEDNLRLSLTVIGDCVNPWMQSRNAWRDTGLRAGARVLEIEIICSDPAEHRRRVESRASDVPGLIPPDWQAVTSHDYHAWDRDHVTVDTADLTAEACADRIRSLL